MRFQKRLKHHLLLAVATAILLALFYKRVPGDDKKYLWSMATAYTSIVLLAATLIIGPLNIIRRITNPVSTDLRRDIGIWCAFLGIAHVIVGIQVHMGNIWLYFVKAVEGKEKLALRNDLFGFANYTGLIGTLILILLLGLSNDISLNVLKSKRWKSLQRWSYAAFVLILAHGIMYQVIENRITAFIIVFSMIVMIPIVLQLKGFADHRKQFTSRLK